MRDQNGNKITFWGGNPESEENKELALDVSAADEARALHRVVRAMHDGHCPACGHLSDASLFVRRGLSVDHVCPACNFVITQEQAEAALAAFRPYFQKALDVFIKWRDEREKKPKCPYCYKPCDTPVQRMIFQRRAGKLVESTMMFCSERCGGNYQMGCEG